MLIIIILSTEITQYHTHQFISIRVPFGSLGNNREAAPFVLRSETFHRYLWIKALHFPKANNHLAVDQLKRRGSFLWVFIHLSNKMFLPSCATLLSPKISQLVSPLAVVCCMQYY